MNISRPQPTSVFSLAWTQSIGFVLTYQWNIDLNLCIMLFIRVLLVVALLTYAWVIAMSPYWNLLLIICMVILYFTITGTWKQEYRITPTRLLHCKARYLNLVMWTPTLAPILSPAVQTVTARYVVTTVITLALYVIVLFIWSALHLRCIALRVPPVCFRLWIHHSPANQQSQMTLVTWILAQLTLALLSIVMLI